MRLKTSHKNSLVGKLPNLEIKGTILSKKFSKNTISSSLFIATLNLIAKVIYIFKHHGELCGAEDESLPKISDFFLIKKKLRRDKHLYSIR